MRPFETGGETSLEFYCNRNNCPLFVVGSHTKKRPNNLVIGRMFDFHLYDAIEVGVDEFAPIKSFGNAGTGAQMGNKVSAPQVPRNAAFQHSSPPSTPHLHSHINQQPSTTFVSP